MKMEVLYGALAEEKLGCQPPVYVVQFQEADITTFYSYSQKSGCFQHDPVAIFTIRPKEVNYDPNYDPCI
jgi:hypothetical protein